MKNIKDKSMHTRWPLLQMGFRPFFLGACIFSLFSVTLWMGLYLFQWQIDALSFYQRLSNWHAHEMIFGYTLAVVAGFLLTAVRNWSGVQTADGWKLFVLFFLWLAARILPYLSSSLLVVAVVDLLFNLVLIVFVSLPLYRVRMWSNISLAGTSLLLLMIANLVFYSGLAGIITDGVHYGIYAGVYLMLALILIMGRRVIPFFTDKALGSDVRLKNYQLIDRVIPVSLLVLAVVDTIDSGSRLAALLAAVLAVLNLVRLCRWYVPGIWKEPLLWVLYSAYCWIIFGFVLKAATLIVSIPPVLVIHAYSYGGIGLMTLGMMARIALGHTGRDIYAPSVWLSLIFMLIMTGSCLRVIFPLFMAMYHVELVAASLLLWLLAYTLFVFIYLPILIKPRVDGQAA